MVSKPHSSAPPPAAPDEASGALLNRRTLAVGALGFASGLPLALSGSTLQAWLTASGIDVRAIGAFSLVGVPYVFKFLWAPLLDRYRWGWPGRRRDWMLLAQVLLALLLLGMAAIEPAHSGVMLLAAAALAIAFVSATQDIAIDAYRTEVLQPRERGFGAASAVCGYRVAMLVSGAGALLLAERLGFGAVYQGMAVLCLLAAMTSVLGPDLPPSLADARDTGLLDPLREFLRRPGAVALLALVCLYKLGDAFAGSLSTTFLLRGLDFSLGEVGAINKGLGLVATIIGALYGGALMARLGLYKALMGFAWLQAATNLGFAWLALSAKSYAAMIVVVGLENLSGGMGTAAFFALLMALCDRRYTATQFALLSAAASLGRVLCGPPAGWLVAASGWPVFFAASFALALPALLVLHGQRRRIEAL